MPESLRSPSGSRFRGRPTYQPCALRDGYHHPLPGSSVPFGTKPASNPHSCRVRRKRQRLPSSLLIGNASARSLSCAPASSAEAFPIKASDITGVISAMTSNRSVAYGATPHSSLHEDLSLVIGNLDVAAAEMTLQTRLIPPGCYRFSPAFQLTTTLRRAALSPTGSRKMNLLPSPVTPYSVWVGLTITEG